MRVIIRLSADALLPVHGFSFPALKSEYITEHPLIQFRRGIIHIIGRQITPPPPSPTHLCIVTGWTPAVVSFYTVSLSMSLDSVRLISWRHNQDPVHGSTGIGVAG